jgi:hypothetical protein
MSNQRRSDGMGGKRNKHIHNIIENPTGKRMLGRHIKSPKRNFASCTYFEILGYAAFSILHSLVSSILNIKNICFI